VRVHMCVCVCARARACVCVCARARACVCVVTMLQAVFEPEIPVLRHKRLCVSYTVWLCGYYGLFI